MAETQPDNDLARDPLAGVIAGQLLTQLNASLLEYAGKLGMSVDELRPMFTGKLARCLANGQPPSEMSGLMPELYVAANTLLKWISEGDPRTKVRLQVAAVLQGDGVVAAQPQVAPVTTAQPEAGPRRTPGKVFEGGRLLLDPSVEQDRAIMGIAGGHLLVNMGNRKPRRLRVSGVQIYETNVNTDSWIAADLRKGVSTKAEWDEKVGQFWSYVKRQPVAISFLPNMGTVARLRQLTEGEERPQNAVTALKALLGSRDFKKLMKDTTLEPNTDFRADRFRILDKQGVLREGLPDSHPVFNDNPYDYAFQEL